MPCRSVTFILPLAVSQPSKFQLIFVVSALLLATWLPSVDQSWADEAKPFGLAKREIWEYSRLFGTPERPPPFRAVPAYTNQVWRSPMFIAAEPQSSRLFALLHHGGGKPTQLVAFEDRPETKEREVLLDLPGRNVYSFCFDPNYNENGHLYLFSNLNLEAFGGQKANRISRVTLHQGSSEIDLDSEHSIIEWRSGGHDGGGIAFGLDGMLYISTGDGTSDSDNWVSGQTLDDLLGGVLRIEMSEWC